MNIEYIASETCPPDYVNRTLQAFSEADKGKQVSISGDVVKVNGKVRGVAWGDATHSNCTGRIVDVVEALNGKVELDSDVEFENPAVYPEILGCEPECPAGKKTECPAGQYLVSGKCPKCNDCPEGQYNVNGASKEGEKCEVCDDGMDCSVLDRRGYFLHAIKGYWQVPCQSPLPTFS